MSWVPSLVGKVIERQCFKHPDGNFHEGFMRDLMLQLKARFLKRF